MICEEGTLFYQELTIFGMMLTQIIFRWIILYRLDKNAMLFPGVTLREFYEVMLPVYYFCVGSCLMTLGEKRDEKIFNLSFFLSLALPAIVKQIESQAKTVSLYLRESKQFHKSSKTTKTIILSTFEVLTNLSTVSEVFVLCFLLLTILLPNLRFLMVGEAYLFSLFYKFLVDAAKYILVLLFLLYSYEMYSVMRKISVKEEESTQNSTSEETIDNSQ